MAINQTESAYIYVPSTIAPDASQEELIRVLQEDLERISIMNNALLQRIIDLENPTP